MRLCDRVFAPHYVEPVLRAVARDSQLRAERSAGSSIVAEMKSGDPFELMDVTGDAAWGRATAAGVVGYVDVTAVSPA